MVDKLRDAALILKAKITKDQVQELLLEATSQDNWQTPTTVLHALADASYNYEQWQKISSFIWQKLKSKKWRKVLKALNLIEFLLKNGPPSILSTFKYQVYQFRSFDGYNCYDEGVDRGESIREKSRAIVDLLTNEELLEEERVKAKTIRERLASASSDAAYSGMGSSSSGSRYGGTHYKNDSSSGGSGGKYAGYGSGSKGGFTNSNTATYSTGSYDQGKSTLDKYKNYSGGGSLYSKENLKDKKKEDKVVEVEKKEEVTVAPKPFEKEARTLKKPGEMKPPPLPNTQVNKTVTTPAVSKPPVQATTGGSTGNIDIFGFEDEAPVTQPAQPTAPTQPVYTAPPPPVAPVAPIAVAPVQPAPQTHPLVNPMYSTTAQMANLNLLGQPQPQQPTVTQPQQQPMSVPNYINPMLPTTASLAFPGVPQQPMYPQQYPAHVNPMYPTTAPMVAGYNPQLPQHMANVASHYPGQVHQQQQPQQQQPQQQQKPVGGITMNTGVAKPVVQKEEEGFGDFESSNKDAAKWLSKDQSNLIDFNDFGSELKQKKKDQTKKSQPAKKKESNQGSLLATAQDFQSFLSGPTATPSPSYNISMNINNVNFGVPSVPVQRPPGNMNMGNMGNMGGMMGAPMQYPGYGQAYPTAQQQQYQYMQQQQYGYHH